MKCLVSAIWITVALFGASLTVPPGNVVFAQVVDDAELEEIIVVGSRRQGRTAIDSAVPVDMFTQQDLDSVSSDDMLEVIKTLIPSFQVRRFPISDGRSFIRPPQLRGMSSNYILALVNGKRRHRSSVVLLGFDGAHGPDLAAIPSIALKSVEILRDGASALYGSDAIAGVMNFNLKDAAEGGELRLQTGMYSEDNESGYLIALNQGFTLGENGFLNISAELSDNEPTSRGTFYNIPIAQSGLSPVEAAQVSGSFDHDLDPTTPEQQRYGPDALTEIYDPVTGQLLTLARGSDDIPDDTDTRYADNLPFAEISDNALTQIWGEPDREAIRSFVNAGYELAGGAMIYGWLNYSDSDGNTSFFHRRPGISDLAPLRTPTGDIYDPRSRYPAGFTPRFFGHVIDRSVTAGVRGEFDNGLSYDFGVRAGESTIAFTIVNTMNPSLGPATPGEFRPGKLKSDERALTADFTMPVDVGFASDLNFAFGFEYRDEGYDVMPGDRNSYEVGPYAFEDPWNFEVDADEAAAGQNGGSVGCFIPGPQFDPISLCHAEDPIHNTVGIGSNGFPGYGPIVTSTYERDSWAAYFDLEADVTDRFLASIAGRYEDFSDFGSNFSWRLAARLQVSSWLSLRSSVGTGFRAPTPGQISTRNVATFIDGDGQPVTAGVFPADHPVSQFFGSVPLQDETSTQFTFGIASQPSDSLTLTLDYYFITTDDRLQMSTPFNIGPAEVIQLQALGIPGATSIAQVRFFTNDVDTETSGLDLVATWNIDWGAGDTTISAAANYNTKEITRRTDHQTDPTDPTPVYYVNDGGVFGFSNVDPKTRASLTGRHEWSNDIAATLRGIWYGDHKDANNSLTVIQKMGGRFYLDFDVTWDVSDSFSLTLGGNNVLDEYPEQPVRKCCGEVYDSASILDWQGSYYYLRAGLRWN